MLCLCEHELQQKRNKFYFSVQIYRMGVKILGIVQIRTENTFPTEMLSGKTDSTDDVSDQPLINKGPYSSAAVAR